MNTLPATDLNQIEIHTQAYSDTQHTDTQHTDTQTCKLQQIVQQQLQ